MYEPYKSIIKELIWFFILAVIAIVIVGFLIKPLPLVYISTSTQECAKIIRNGEVCDCSEMPERYERVWVK